MVTDSSSSTTFPSYSISISEKLTKSNYRLWRAQILPSIRAAHLEDILTGAEKKPVKTIVERSGDASDASAQKPNPAYTLA
jgi:hypothetical protein